MFAFFKKPWVRVTSIVLLAIVLLVAIVEVCYLYRTYTPEEMEKAIVKVERLTGYSLVADGEEVLYFSELSSDNIFLGLDTVESQVLCSSVSTGVWINEWSFVPSCSGTILAKDYAPDVSKSAKAMNVNIDSIVATNIRYMEGCIDNNDEIKKEVDYYISVHNGMDSEYDKVVSYSKSKADEQTSNYNLLARLEALRNAKKLEVRPLSYYNVSMSGNSAIQKLWCYQLPFVSEDEKCVSGLQYKKMDAHSVLLKVESMMLPDDAYSVSLPLLGDFEYQMTDTVYVPKYGKKKARKLCLTDAFSHRPMFDADGRFLGFTPDECRDISELDTLGFKILGKCEEDTLVRGTFTDSLGVYKGQLTYDGKPCGVGTLNYFDGSYYEGEWFNGDRHGNGFFVSPGQMVKAGEWKEGKYKGERMVYNSLRIYGIDISRYQHEIGRKRYNIDWKNLRVSYLGAKNSGDASDSIDYPVSFVYIKSTQGTTIKSKYYATDAQAARKHGIICGAYHFYSVKTKAIDQARFFLKNTKVLATDLPPVLDVEPTDREIAKGGGEQKLFESIRVWMNTVEASTGKRPILYVSQKFIRQHLIKAPDICEKYQVWIARYGEYRPEVKLLFWQLTPFGRVKGIHGDVDINVFNGYHDQFHAFKEEVTKKG